MPEHFHLLVSEPERGTPSTVMQAIKLGFARRVIGRIQSTAPVHIWQRRFYDFSVFSERKRIEKLRYIHRNPVKRGLVAESDQWLWSSFRFYAHGEEGPVKVNGWEALKMKIRVVDR